MNKTDIPVAIGPGTQPAGDDGAELEYMPMPSAMMTFSMPSIPEPDEIFGVDEAIGIVTRVHGALCAYRAGEPAIVIALDELDEKNIDLVNQVLGNGEVSIRYHGDVDARIQESVLAGVWRVQYIDDQERVIRDVIEVAAIPGLVRDAAFTGAAERVAVRDDEIPGDVYNAPPLLTEIDDKLASSEALDTPHVINLSLLPHTQEDIDFLTESLGSGHVAILSRGYGNCRITGTLTRDVWWVQYFNSQETLILNTIEISKVPDVACAAQEDIDDSAQRLQEILEVYA